MNCVEQVYCGVDNKWDLEFNKWGTWVQAFIIFKYVYLHILVSSRLCVGGSAHPYLTSLEGKVKL